MDSKTPNAIQNKNIVGSALTFLNDFINDDTSGFLIRVVDGFPDESNGIVRALCDARPENNARRGFYKINSQMKTQLFP